MNLYKSKIIKGENFIKILMDCNEYFNKMNLIYLK